jgi:hypothetical protein
MNERMRRLWAAEEAKTLGYGGVCLVARATGLSRMTITAGMRELAEMEKGLALRPGPGERIRRPGAGRKRLTDQDPTLIADLKALVEPVTRGDPGSLLLWTSKSLRHLEREINRDRHRAGRTKIGDLLQELNYSLQANCKTKEGTSHPDRDAQFEYIHTRTGAFERRRQPIISVDTKKKELLGDFKNAGREWHRQGEPERVRVHDFPDKQLGKAIPYGVYDLTYNQGWVSVGTSHDTAEFATETIRRWWVYMGSPTYGRAIELLIIADGGGSNGSRSRLWKVCLQRLADTTGLRISVCHYPPGTSKWNKIEHRMFSAITQNWRGRPLVSLDVIVNLIRSTRTETGLQIRAELDTTLYQTGIEVSDEELAAVQLAEADFHGDWNYSISPRSM